MGAHLVIERPGLFSTLQDAGRFGYQRFGISASGAMDPFALALANALVGNPRGMAAVELTMLGLSATVEGGPLRLALAGADMALTIDGRPAEGWRAYALQPGARIEIGPARAGMRAYLAIAGGFAVPPTLGSLSTHSRSGIGGLEGRALRAGDRLALNGAPAGPLLALPPSHRPAARGPFRVLLGPQDDHFTPEGVATFLSSDYRVSDKADRMGAQLDGPQIAHRDGFNIVSDGIVNGAIQVPGHGRPVVLLADRQTTGGYPKIATVIGPDLWRLGQARPGDVLRLSAVTAEEAEAASRAHEAELAALIAAMVEEAGPAGLSSERLLSHNLVGGVCSALDTDHA
ncbi:biotin-dependent carboxyltransferase family protein [Starkeya koreensis]|uniref:Biotin-dependent carboxyltransferase family protein n=1 Tax=Ancylobacter koreensis TaxID=266121 RepID=A0ABT0DJL8_9HYPH|nr:biotin-dependent carboxyltransferase family protein [Ancylobacter koreensis]MCK0207379.1 biotin-dependent carboxyltransferase family protein [Ancylobacter koreensis]